MCARYEASLSLARLFEHFRVRALQEQLDKAKRDVLPGYRAPFIRRPRELDSGDEAVPYRELQIGAFGMLPHWAKDEKLAKSTYNARSETVASKPAFRDAWKKAQHCIIPGEAFYEPDWRTGSHIPTRISRSDGAPLGIAGLWSWWRPVGGDEVLSFTMLTINATVHPIVQLPPARR